MKKFLPKVITLALLTLLLLVGCSDSVDKDDKESTKDNDNIKQEEVVIKFAAQNDNTPATQAVIDEFNSKQDKYKVEWVQMTNDSAQMHDQLITSLSSGSEEYDLLSMDVVWAGEFAGAGYLEPLDVRIKDVGLSKDDFNAGSMASGTYKGKQYTLPFFPDLGLLYYRADIVSEEDAAKLDAGEYTYADLGEMAAKYTGQGGTKYGFVYQSKQYEGLTVNLTEFSSSYGDLKGGLEQMYAFSKAAWAPKDILNFDEGATHTNFEQGNAVFARNWPYQYGRIIGKEDGVTVKAEDVGIAPLPNGGAVGGWLLGLNKNSKHTDGAWEFIQFLAGKEGQKIMATKGGYLPGFNSLLEDADVQGANEMLTNKGFQNALANTIARPVSPDYNKVSDTIQVEAHKYISSGSSVEAAVEAIEAALPEK